MSPAQQNDLGKTENGQQQAPQTRSPVWYRTTTVYCPVCGKSERTRERMTGLRPRNYYDRNVAVESYDHCDD